LIRRERFLRKIQSSAEYDVQQLEGEKTQIILFIDSLTVKPLETVGAARNRLNEHGKLVIDIAFDHSDAGN